MELTPERLIAQLPNEPLRPVYLIAGSEPLRVLEAADAVRARARATASTSARSSMPMAATPTGTGWCRASAR